MWTADWFAANRVDSAGSSLSLPGSRVLKEHNSLQKDAINRQKKGRQCLRASCSTNVQDTLLVESSFGSNGEFVGDSFGRGLAGARNGLAAANPNFDRAGNDAANPFVVDGAQVAIMKGERDSLRTGCGEMNTLESDERANWRAVNAGMRKIKLDHFIAGNRTGVRDAHGGCDGCAGSGLLWVDFCVGVIERRKAQTVAEGVERLLGEVAISAAVHAVAAKGWKLGDGFVKSDRQSSGRIVIAGKNVGDSDATFFAGIPGFEDRGGVLLSPVNSHSAACGENDYERLSSSTERFEELLLRFGEIEVEAVAAKKARIAVFGFLPFKLSREAHDGNDDIGLARSIDGFLDQVGRQPKKTRSGFPAVMEILHAHGVRVAGLQMNERGHGALAVRCPI